ncbi:MAG: hypothetical protein AB7N54_07845 [Alphaproteobacteria bacterium]
MHRVDRIRVCAELSIRRALGFTLLGILVAQFGLSWDAGLALKTGAVLMALVFAVLLWKAYGAPTYPYRRTETWLLLDRQHDLPEDVAQRTIGGVLRDIYLRYATWAAALAGAQWLVALAVATA